MSIEIEKCPECGRREFDLITIRYGRWVINITPFNWKRWYCGGPSLGFYKSYNQVSFNRLGPIMVSRWSNSKN